MVFGRGLPVIGMQNGTFGNEVTLIRIIPLNHEWNYNFSSNRTYRTLSLTTALTIGNCGKSSNIGILAGPATRSISSCNFFIQTLFSIIAITKENRTWYGNLVPARCPRYAVKHSCFKGNLALNPLKLLQWQQTTIDAHLMLRARKPSLAPPKNHTSTMGTAFERYIAL
jgi:hypothetical protein